MKLNASSKSRYDMKNPCACELLCATCSFVHEVVSGDRSKLVVEKTCSCIFEETILGENVAWHVYFVYIIICIKEQ